MSEVLTSAQAGVSQKSVNKSASWPKKYAHHNEDGDMSRSEVQQLHRRRSKKLQVPPGLHPKRLGVMTSGEDEGD
jgi:hypothetical protein